MKQIHDSGKRSRFVTGAVRDAAEDKPRPELISPVAELRLAAWLSAGARKYADRNWEKGMPLSRIIASLKRHLLQYQTQDTSEDHLSALLCNAMFLLHTDAMIQRGMLPDSLDDVPRYNTQHKGEK